MPKILRARSLQFKLTFRSGERPVAINLRKLAPLVSINKKTTVSLAGIYRPRYKIAEAIGQ